ncbi:MAG: 5-formyltetrahydrofolate cyclo-ligase [Puniceicoccales bacterium]|nr:5-formyltetrahydrofolate cyclo-ligase [Puniceicoccales bacterium]
MNNASPAEKAAIRACVKAQYQLGNPNDEAAALLTRLQMLAHWRFALRPCLYCSLPDEAPTHAILKDCFVRGLIIHIPRVAGEGRLALHPVHSFDALRPGAFGILEPAPESPECALQDTDCVLVPGLAFDLSGRRIGRGGGYYDRFLVQLPPCVPRIALAREWQLFPSVPAETHDARMDWILTPERICACASGKAKLSSHGKGHFPTSQPSL